MDNEGKKYDLIVNQFDNDRCKTLREKIYLDFFIEGLLPAGHILDVGCGMGEPKFCRNQGVIRGPEFESRPTQ